MASAKQRALILISALIIIAFQFGLFVAMQRFQTRKPDFANLYQTGRLLDHERFPQVFTRFPSLDSDEYRLWLHDREEYPPDTLHPPCELVIYAALALFKFRTAYLTWWVCNLAFLFLSVYLLWTHVPGLQRSYPYLLILMATFFPVLVALVQGQNSIMLLFALTLTFCALEREQDFRAGFMLGLSMFKFILVTPMALWLIFEKRWKSVAGFCAGCMVLLLVALGLVGFSGVESYVRLLAGFGQKTPEQPGTQAIMPNLRGLLYAFSGSLAPESVLVMTTLLLSLALLIWVDLKLKRYANQALLYALQVLLAAMISYHFYPHDGAILVLPVMILLAHAFGNPVQRTFKVGVLVCSACAYLAPFVGGIYVGMPVVGLSSLALLIIARSEALRLPIANHLSVRSDSINVAS